MTTTLDVDLPGAGTAPDLSEKAVRERAARAVAPPLAEPRHAAAPPSGAPAATPGGYEERRPPEAPGPPGRLQVLSESPRRGQERLRRLTRARPPLAAWGLLVSLAANAALAAYLLIPRWGPLARFHSGALQMLAPAAALGTVIAAAAAYRGVRQALAGRRSEDLLTLLAAAVATVVSASGMWVFFTDKLHVSIWFRPETSSIFEIAAIALALMKRRSMQKETEKARIEGRQPDPDAGRAEGIGMWVIVTVSGGMAAMAATNIPEAVFRLVPPMLAAYLFERLLLAERHQSAGKAKKTIAFAVSFERILVGLRLAEPAGRTAGQAAVSRYMTDWAEAAEGQVAAGKSGGRWRQRRAARRYRTARRRALERTEFWKDQQVQQELLVKTRMLCTSAEEIASAAKTAVAMPWQWAAAEQDTAGGRPDDPATIAADLQAGQRNLEEVHRLLRARDSDTYTAVAAQLGTAASQHGAKRLAAFAALYAVPGAIEENASGLAAAWLGEHCPLAVNSRQIRLNRQEIRPLWEAEGYGPFGEPPAGLHVA